MDYSAGNSQLWNIIIQFGIIGATLLIANLLKRKIPFFKKSLLPTAFVSGALLLAFRNIFPDIVSTNFLEMLTYHGIAIGFIAMSLRVTEKHEGDGKLVMPKSGALIVSCYVLQGFFGLLAVLALAALFMPELYLGSGLLLPMGYGQGPGQANNIGTLFEGRGFVGGRSFGLSLAAAGYISACVAGIIYLNILNRRGKLPKAKHDEVSGSTTVDTFQTDGEIPISESVDRFSMQIALVLMVYFGTYLTTWGITSLLASTAPGVAKTVNPLLWGFNFITGSLLAILVRVVFGRLRKHKVMTRQYQNNYLLSRISGVAFDMMITAGVASINIEDLKGLWVPFIVLSLIGMAVTLIYLSIICRRLYGDYYYAGMLSMYGMMTGTISSGILLLREVDPELKTPAANNLVGGSSFAIAFGAPMLVIVGLEWYSVTAALGILGILAVYFALMVLFILKVGPRGKKRSGNTDAK